MQSEQLGELAKALAKSQSNMNLVTKDSNNPFFKSKYAGLDAVMHEFKVSFAPNGLAVVQEFATNDNITIMTLRTTLMHESGQWISGIQSITPKGNGVQDIMSASTYARRYGVCAITGIASTDEDDDGNMASGKGTSEKKEFKTPQPIGKSAQKESSSPVGAKKTIVATHVTSVKPGEFMIKLDKGNDMYTSKEVVAKIIKDNIGKPIEVIYTVDADMFQIILDVVKV